MLRDNDKIIRKSTGGGQCSSDEYYSDELAACTFARITLVLFVVIGHCMNFWTTQWFVGVPVFEAKELSLFVDWSHQYRTQAFTLISGYIFYYLKYEKGSYQVFRNFLINKFKRLIIPYVFIATIWVVPLSVLFYDWTTMDIVKKFVLCTSPSQLWFLWMLFDVFIIAWVLSDRLQNDKVALGIAILAEIIGIVGNKVLPNIFCIWIAMRFLPLFILGMKLRAKKEWWLRRISIPVYVIVDVVLFMVWKYCIGVENSLSFKILGVILGFGLNIVGALMAFFVLQEIARRIHWKNIKIIQYLSKRTMIIYLLHQQIIYFTISYFNGIINPYLNMLINFIVSVSVSILLANILISNKWTRFLVGEKKR